MGEKRGVGGCRVIRSLLGGGGLRKRRVDYRDTEKKEKEEHFLLKSERSSKTWEQEQPVWISLQYSWSLNR